MDGEALRAGAGKRVLVVDDDPLGRKLVALRLKDAGFGVETAGTAEEALRMAAETPPDAVISDVRMPGMDGFQLCRSIRRDARLARVPFLLLSSVALQPREQRRASNLGVEATFLRTPDLHDVILALAAAFRDAE
jgi:CheY-like chemotaxis protein